MGTAKIEMLCETSCLVSSTSEEHAQNCSRKIDGLTWHTRLLTCQSAVLWGHLHPVLSLVGDHLKGHSVDNLGVQGGNHTVLEGHAPPEPVGPHHVGHLLNWDVAGLHRGRINLPSQNKQCCWDWGSGNRHRQTSQVECCPCRSCCANRCRGLLCDTCEQEGRGIPREPGR